MSAGASLAQPPVAAGSQPLYARNIDSTEPLAHAPGAHRQVRRDLGQWRQHEGALQHPGMRHVQPRFVDDAVAEHQYVDVDQARAPALLAHALQLALGLETEIEQRPWRQ